jgi:hypothetical protein
MDIAELKTRQAHDDGAEMRVSGPDGKLTDFYIRLVGVDSEQWEKTLRAAEKASLKGKEPNLPELVASMVIDWRGLKNNGVDVPFSKESALDLLKNAPYICTQCDKFAADRVNFLTPKSRS